MAKYKFTREAEHDLEDIVDYTANKWGLEQALHYIDSLEKRCQIITDNPSIGTSRGELAKNLLCFPHESHMLYYIKQRHGITIVRVLHQSMEPQNRI